MVAVAQEAGRGRQAGIGGCLDRRDADPHLSRDRTRVGVAPRARFGIFHLTFHWDRGFMLPLGTRTNHVERGACNDKE